MNTLVPKSLYHQPPCLQTYDSCQEQQATSLLIWQLKQLATVLRQRHSFATPSPVQRGNFQGLFTIHQMLPGPSWRRQPTSLVKWCLNRPPAPQVLVLSTTGVGAQHHRCWCSSTQLYLHGLWLALMAGEHHTNFGENKTLRAWSIRAPCTPRWVRLIEIITRYQL